MRKQVSKLNEIQYRDLPWSIHSLIMTWAFFDTGISKGLFYYSLILSVLSTGPLRSCHDQTVNWPTSIHSLIMTWVHGLIKHSPKSFWYGDFKSFILLQPYFVSLIQRVRSVISWSDHELNAVKSQSDYDMIWAVSPKKVFDTGILKGLIYYILILVILTTGPNH